MRGVGRYPYDRWAKITRREACESSRLSWLFASARPLEAIADARTILGAAPTFGAFTARVATPSELALTAGEELGILLAGAPGGPPMLVTMGPALARVLADRVLGGAGTDVAPGPVAISRAEAGLVAYVFARAIGVLSGPVSAVIDALPLRDAIRALGEERVIVWSTELAIGGARGNVSLVAPIAAIPAGPPPPLALPSLRVRAYLDVGAARLPARELAAMQVDDTLVPDALWLDLRRGPDGHARLRVARSARTFELALTEHHQWIVRTVLSSPAPHAPHRRASREPVGRLRPKQTGSLALQARA